MGRYILFRLLKWIPSVFILLLLIYALVFFGAGDPIKLIFLQAPGDVAYDPDRVEAIRDAAGLNRPFLVQFMDYLGNIANGNFGNSLVSGRSVNSMISAALPVTLKIGLTAIFLLSIVGIILGVIAALNQNKLLDNLIVGFALIVWGIPVFVAGPLIIVFLVLVMDMDVPYGWSGLLSFKVIVPLLVLGLNPMALIIRQARAGVLEVLSEDYVRTARAKGIPNYQVVVKHIMRPVLTPVVSQIGLLVIATLNNSILIEKVFGLPGLGRLTETAIKTSDYPVILAIVLIFSTVVMASNLLVDISYPLLDPRAAAKKTGDE
ncbi:ABC-type dipeptide/oligopeptide/nickel transport system, permease component [Cohaesibacter marisflavi]|uniref:ABC-type dipeptide/oligopeptide/nickel transport system, permease component n=1 Tax=Cohaesibacter marisflavi TaxID=655353 RepID=A0A1I5CIE1_9HYPH|nr:ABC transporter permease [Cohaesibacter marisflavi]SFN86780.1 ABC-type dipeptide/oligopeptide/nickel transport system, permease component [Cohaesibacter marisflavi]